MRSNFHAPHKKPFVVISRLISHRWYPKTFVTATVAYVQIPIASGKFARHFSHQSLFCQLSRFWISQFISLFQFPMLLCLSSLFKLLYFLFKTASARFHKHRTQNYVCFQLRDQFTTKAFSRCSCLRRFLLHSFQRVRTSRSANKSGMNER